MSKWAFINESFVLEETATVHYRDLAIQRGYGIFDFLKVIDHTPLFLNEHLERFFHSARNLHLPVAQTKKELEQIITQLIIQNAVPYCGIRLTLTGGYSVDGYQPAKPNLIISQHSFQAPSEEQFQKGISLMSYEHQRQLPHVKSIDYLMAIWLQPRLRQYQADDILYHNNGIITECPRANFFIVTADDKVITPKQNILQGITRNRLLKMAGSNFAIEERDFSLKEMLEAKEAFITSTTKNILPVHAIDGRTIGDGGLGPITKQLAGLLQTHLQSNAIQCQ